MAGVTAKDIAAKLNMSPSAVSLALNGKPGVSEATRALVNETAARLGYKRPGAEGEPTVTKTICFVRYAGSTVSIAEHTSFASFVLQGAETRATELGYGILVRHLREGDLYNAQTLAIIRKADGIIFLGTDVTAAQLPELDRLFEAFGSTPIVVVDSAMLSGRTDCVVNDCYGGAKAAVSYLIKNGCRRVGYVRSKQRIRNFIEREAGAKAALKSGGASLAVTVDVDISSDGAFQNFDAWLKTSPELPEAFFAENDVIAAAVIRALKKHGCRVPEEVSVMGFDDIPTCEMIDPPLSTVHLFKEELGALACEQLDRGIKRGEVPHQSNELSTVKTVLSTKIVPRYSIRKK